MKASNTGHQVAQMARRMGVEPLREVGAEFGFVAENGDVYDIADIFERFEKIINEMQARVKKLEGLCQRTP